MTTTAEVNGLTGQLAELVKQVQAGHEVVLTQGHKPVARLVPAVEMPVVPGATLQIRSFKGRRVLTPSISQSELAAEMFASK